MYVAPGAALPSATLGELVEGELRTVTTTDVFGRHKAVIVGVPAAFSPVCSKLHMPNFVELAPRFRSAGFEVIACISSSNPWSLSAWAAQIDPEHRIHFLSDANLEFGRACGLVTSHTGMHLGTCLSRFTMTLAGGRVERVAVETSILQVTCSSAEGVCNTAFP